ncbi:hypothetical protein Aduo_014046 [Ancylostoma duodenale]
MKPPSVIVFYCSLFVVSARPQSDARKEIPEANGVADALDDDDEQKFFRTACPPYTLPTYGPIYGGPPHGCGPHSPDPYGPTAWPWYTNAPPYNGPSTCSPPIVPTTWPCYYPTSYGTPPPWQGGGPHSPPPGGDGVWQGYTSAPPYNGPPSGTPCTEPHCMGHTDQGNHFGQTKHPNHGNGNTRKPQE